MKQFAWFGLGMSAVASVTATPAADSSQPSPTPTSASVTQNAAGPKVVIARPPDIDISDYGAIGDGKNDDAAALQGAIDAAATAGGGAVYVKRMALTGNTIALGSTITLKQKVILVSLALMEGKEVKGERHRRRREIVSSWEGTRNPSILTPRAIQPGRSSISTVRRTRCLQACRF